MCLHKMASENLQTSLRVTHNMVSPCNYGVLSVLYIGCYTVPSNQGSILHSATVIDLEVIKVTVIMVL